MATTRISEHVNSEGERISIDLIRDGAFAGQRCLVIHDDAPSQALAPMLLDEGTEQWLRQQFAAGDGRASDG